MFKPIAATAILLAGLCNQAMAEPIPYAQLNANLVTHFIQPKLDTFAKATKHAHQQVQSVCDAGTVQGAEAQHALEGAFHRSMDGWQSITHLRIGPIQKDERYFRIQFWPDKKNLTSKHMRSLLKGDMNNITDPERFSVQSVAVQGFGAWERLLSSDLHKTALEGDGFEAMCAYHEAIANSLSSIAHDLSKEWQTLYPDQLIGQNASLPYRSEKEWSVVLFGTLDMLLQISWDQKLKRPLAADYDTRKIRRAENYRLNRSLRNIRINLLSVKAMLEAGFYPALYTVGKTALVEKLTVFLTDLEKQSEAFPDDLAPVINDAAGYEDLVKFRDAILEFQEIIDTDLTAALELPQGFNALDGD